MKKILLSSFILFSTSVGMLFAQEPDTHSPTANGDQFTNLYLNRAATVPEQPSVFVNGVAGGDCRGMAQKDGRLFFSSRKSNTEGSYEPQIFVVDGATGSLLKEFDLPANQITGLTYPANDIAVDDAGNLFVSNMVVVADKTFRILYLNINVAQSTIQASAVLNYTSSDDKKRLETFDVFGDVKSGNGFIMVPVTNSDIVLKFTVTGGNVNATPEEITIKSFYPDPANVFETVNGFGNQPRIHIVSADRFYIEGNFRDPVLYDMSGNAVDGFQNNTALAPTSAEPKPERGDGDDKRGGPSGVTEFELNGKHYLIVASTNTDFVTPQQFDLFEFKNSEKKFAEMSLLFRFPNAGMGKNGNGYASISQVQIINDGTKDKARIFIYAYKNGYGIYDFTQGSSSSVSQYFTNEFGYNVNQRTIELTENAESLVLYNVSGQKIQEVSATNMITAPTSGIFLLKAAFKNLGEKTVKVIIP